MQRFHVYLLKPTRYDDDGYPIQWVRSVVPSNSLACLSAILDDAARREVLGPDVEIVAHLVDETNTKVDVDAILHKRRGGERSLVCLVGVQTNQFPRALDIARPLRAAGVPVCIGGFHVSGVISMLGVDAWEIAPARDLGVSMFAGEAEEGRFDEVLRDGFADTLKPLYNHIANMPSLIGAPLPMLERELVDRSFTKWSSFDLGRGCPFECSFCTIINVQGRKSRFRTADELETIVRQNWAKGIARFVLTDDNFARNKNWEAYADRLIELRTRENIAIRMIIQVDTMAHRTPRFIEKVVAAGANLIFVGLENINPDNLAIVKKRQNRIEEYRESLLAWKRFPVIITCGYIIGFPNDTKASILRDIDILKRELPIDLLTLNMLTPLPGSEDHRRMRTAGQWMDPDFNKYDLNYRVTHHPRMSDQEWDEVLIEAHRKFFSFEHTKTIFKRMVQLGNGMKLTMTAMLLSYREGLLIDGVSYAEFGLGRIVRRKQRRFGMPLESPLIFYPREWWRFLSKSVRYGITYIRLYLQMRDAWRLWNKQAEFPYYDGSLAAAGGLDPIVEETRARSTPHAIERQRKRGAAAEMV